MWRRFRSVRKEPAAAAPRASPWTPRPPADWIRKVRRGAPHLLESGPAHKARGLEVPSLGDVEVEPPPVPSPVAIAGQRWTPPEVEPVPATHPARAVPRSAEPATHRPRRGETMPAPPLVLPHEPAAPPGPQPVTLRRERDIEASAPRPRGVPGVACTTYLRPPASPSDLVPEPGRTAPRPVAPPAPRRARPQPVPVKESDDHWPVLPPPEARAASRDAPSAAETRRRERLELEQRGWPWSV